MVGLWKWAVIALGGIAVIGADGFGDRLFRSKAPRPPGLPDSPSELLQKSLAKQPLPELKIAYALHPDVCAIELREEQKWTVECKGVPLHFYRQITFCDPGPPEACGPAPSTYSDCRTISWYVAASGEPEDLFGGHNPPYSSIEDDCLPKGTLAPDRAEMNRRGMALPPVKIFDFSGHYTGKPKSTK